MILKVPENSSIEFIYIERIFLSILISISIFDTICTSIDL